MKRSSFPFLRFLLTGALALPVFAQNPVSCSTPGATANSLRNEGKTEQVGDFTFACTNTTARTLHATVTAVIGGSLPVTSMTLDAATGQTEAAVLVVPIGGSTQTQFGTVSGSTVTFASVPIFPGSSTFYVTNVRVDATSIVVAPNGAPTITESVSVTGAPGISANFGPLAVGTVNKGLTSSVTGIVNFGVGTGITADFPAAIIHFGEVLRTAFKVRGNPALNSTVGDWLSNNTESGYFVQLPVNGVTVSNNAQWGTRIRVIFNNVPAGIGVYVPASIATDQTNVSNGGLPYGTAAATASESGPFSPPPIATSPPGYGGAAQLIQLAVSNGTAEAIYEISQDSLQVVESYSIPMFLSGTVPGGAGTETATISFVPLVTPGTIPDFKQLAASTSTFDLSQFTLAVSTSALPAGEAGVPYNQTLAATGGTPPYTWSLDSGSTTQLSSLGLSLNPANSQISGVPGAGIAGLTVTVTDSTNASSSRLLSLTIVPSVMITTTALPNGQVNHPYTAALSATSGTGSYTWTIANGTLPPGLSLNSSTGAITGTPTTTGSYSFTLQVTDAAGGSAFLALSGSSAVQISAALTISTTLMSVAVQGEPYSRQLAASGGSGAWPACPWTLTSSTLPTSFSLSCQGTLSSPAIAVSANTQGTFSFTAQVTDSSGAAASKAFSLTIDQAGTLITANLPDGTAIVNIQAIDNGAATANSDQSIFYQPFNTNGFPIEYTIQPGTYTFRLLDSADASAVFSQLTNSQLSTVLMAWTYHTQASSYYITDYLVFDSSALTDSTAGQLFSGAPLASAAYAGAQSAYDAAVSLGTYNQVHLQSRTATAMNSVTFDAAQTLVFVLADSYLPDNAGGISVLIAPAAPALSITTTSLPAGQAGAAYPGAALTANGGSGHYVWTASGLPAGLVLSTGGLLSGTPQAGGVYSPVITVTDPVSGLFVSSTLPITVASGSSSLLITTTSMPDGTVGIPYSGAFQATGGSGASTWSVVYPGGSGIYFPPGVSFSSSTGVLTGIPSAAGSYTFTAVVQDSLGSRASQLLTIVIHPAGLSISTTSLPAATQGAPYNQTLSAAGGAGGYSWTVVGGTFTQAGFSLHPSTGALTGTPNTAGTLQFTVQVTDSAAATATQAYSLPISLASASAFDFAVANSSLSDSSPPVPDYDVVRITAAGGAVNYICSGAACGAQNITADTAGNIYGHDGSGITKFSPTQGPTQILSLSGGAGGIALDGLGNLIFVDNATDAVYRVKLDGTGLTQVALFPIQSPGEAQNTYIAIDHSGNYIVVSDEGGSISVYSFTPAGAVTLLASISCRTGGVAVDGSGNIILTDSTDSAVLKIDSLPPYTVSTVASGYPLTYPLGLTIEPDTGDFLVVDSGEAKSLLRVTPAGAVTSVVTGNPELYAPGSITAIPVQTAAPLTIAPASLPAGLAGQSYGPVILGASGGSGNCTWWAIGLPAGLTMSASGIISGVPLAGGLFSVSITARDQVTNQTGTLSVALSIYSQSSPLSVSASPSSIDVAIGGTVSATFHASGGVPPYSFQAFGLPRGVTLSASGILSGAPSQPGNFHVTVQVTDQQPASGWADLAVNVLGLDPTPLPAGTAGQFYSAAVNALGGVPPYSFAAASLPAELRLSAAGNLSGTAQTAGTFSFAIHVTDSNGVSVSGTLSLRINSPTALIIPNVTFPPGRVNQPYSETAGANGGSPPYNWSISSGAPPAGLTFRSSGLLAGVPTAPGFFSFGVMVTDSAGAVATAPASLEIQPAPLTVTSGSLLPSGMLGIAYPRQLLAAHGGVAPYTWSPSGHSLPDGLSLSPNGVISGVPAATGDFTEAVTVTDATGANGIVTLSLSIRPPAGPDLQLTAGTLVFSLPIPATAPPAAQSVGVLPTDPDHQVSYTFSVSPPSPWLNVTSGSLTPSTLTVAITQAALALDPGDYQATITVSCISSSCSGRRLSVAIDLSVGSMPPELRVLNSLVSFATISGAAAPIKGSMTIQNAGGGTIGFGSIACEAAWCAVGPAPQTLGGGVSAQIPITVNPGLLSAGYHRTQVDIASSAGKGVLPVGLLIAPLSTMYLTPSGMQFDMPAGSAPGNPEGSFYVTVTDAAPDQWSAALVPGTSWLSLSTANGSSSAGQPGVVSFSINHNAAILDPGAYYGRIRITSSTLINSPQDFEVVLNILKATDPLQPEPQPAGLLFITQAGASTPPRNVTVYSGSATGLTFQTSATTSDGADWLSVAPSIGNTAAKNPAATQVTVNTAGLQPGIYSGSVGYSLSAAAVSTVNVTLIVVGTSSAARSVSGARLSKTDCVPGALAVTQNGLVNNFWSPVAWPTPMSIILSDDCGTPVGTGQIIATFSNGDPPLVLLIVDPAAGLYSGTWTPRKSNSQMSIVVRASADGFPDATSELLGTTTPNAAPILTPASTLHIFNPLVGNGLAPGTIVQIYGQNLAAGPEAATTMPLPADLQGTEVVIGGISAPLYYVSPGQVNAQIPFELDASRPYQVILIANGALTTPDTVQLTPAMPGVAAMPDSSLIAQHADGSLVTQDNPARSGEYLVAYLAGMGFTNDMPLSGTESPSDPLARPRFQPALTINDSPYPILFAGLTPGLVGLYQMNFQAPAGLPEGNITIVVWQNEQASNQTVLPYRP